MELQSPESGRFTLVYVVSISQISTFVNDYTNALARANAFDAKVKADASAISSDYADIVALSIRQTLGACEITVSKTSSGAFNTSDITTFMKEISSSGVWTVLLSPEDLRLTGV